MVPGRPQVIVTSVLAWTLGGLVPVILLAGALVSRSDEVTLASLVIGLFELAALMGLLAFAAVGALVASRRPRDPIGWMLLVMAVSFSASISLEEYLGAAPRDPFPGIAWLALASQVLWIPFFALTQLVILVFPDGRLPSSRWRAFVFAFVMFFGMRAVADLGAPVVGPDDPTALGYANPLPFADSLRTVGSVVPGFGPIYILWFVVPAIALFRRLRRSNGAERQQLKWFVYAAAVALAFVVVLALTEALGLGNGALGDAISVLAVISFSLLPMSIGVAVLRYRLYDIDVLINRTLVYGALTASLGAAYVGSVLLLQTILRPFTAGSDVAVAVSTLGVVALFQPLRRRIQHTVDRRFYRSRYDAQSTLDMFAARLRDDVDLDGVREQLLAAVQGTVQPRQASVWLRGGPAP